MKRFAQMLLMISSTFFMIQPSFALSKKQNLQVEILILDATMSLAGMGSAGAQYAAREVYPEYRPYPLDRDVPQRVKDYVNSIDAASGRAALNSCLTCDSLDWASKEYTSPLQIIILGRYASRTSGMDIARGAANKLAQSANPNTWGPDLLWEVTKEAARNEIKKGSSEEEIGRAAAKASWNYVLNISGKIRKVIKSKIAARYLADELNGKEVLASLKKGMEREQFKQGLPEAQDFYIDAVENLEQEMRNQYLID